MATNAALGVPSNIRIVVVGDAKVGKTSLIRTLVSEHFSQDSDELLDSWLREVNITPDNMGAEKVSLTIVDTPSFSWRSAERQALNAPPESENHVKKRDNVCRELERASVIVLVYDISRNSTFVNMKHYWLPLIRDEIRGPPKQVVVVGNKLDTQPKAQMRRHSALTQKFAPILKAFKMVDACLQCSCKNLLNIQEVFYYARKAVIYPVKPLFDLEGRTVIKMKEGFERALRRCFRVFDRDRDEMLCDAELRRFQSVCFDTTLQDADIDGVHKVLAQKGDGNVGMSTKVGCRGITLDGFLCLNRLFLERNLSETSWLVLRYLNYKVKDSSNLDTLELVCPDKVFGLVAGRDESVELTSSGHAFFQSLFSQFDRGAKGFLDKSDVQRALGVCPPEYWSMFPDACFELRHGYRGIDRGYWMSLWSALTLLRPDLVQRYLYYLGYNLPVEDIESAQRITNPRSRDFRKNKIRRNVLRVFVFGRRGVGKTTLMKNIARPAAQVWFHKMRDSRATGQNVKDFPQHYVGCRSFVNSEEDPDVRADDAAGATSSSSNKNMPDETSPTLIFTVWPFDLVMQGLDSKQTLSTVLNSIDDVAASKDVDILETCDVAMLMFEPPPPSDVAGVVDDDGGFGAMIRIQNQLAKHIPCFFLCNKWDKRSTGFEASEEWERIMQHCRALKLRLPSRLSSNRRGSQWSSSSSSRNDHEDTVPICHSAISTVRREHLERVFDNLVLTAKQPQSMCPMFASEQRSYDDDREIWMMRIGILTGTIAMMAVAGGYLYWRLRVAREARRGSVEAPIDTTNPSTNPSTKVVSTSHFSGESLARGVLSLLLRTHLAKP